MFPQRIVKILKISNTQIFAEIFDERDRQYLTYRPVSEFETTPERVHNVRATTSERETIYLRTINLLCVLSACALRMVCISEPIKCHAVI